jgi:hypothetical protein
VSDHGGVFLDHQGMQIYTALGIQMKEIDKRQSWQNLIETAFTILGITCAGTRDIHSGNRAHCAQCSKQFPLFHKGKVKEKGNRVDANDEFVNGCPK